MQVIPLSPFDLGLASLLVLALAGLSFHLGLGLSRSLLISGLRTTIQLLLVGLVLKALFTYVHLRWLALMACFMVLMAGREVMRRQKHRLTGWWGFGIGTFSMFVCAFSVTVFCLKVVIQPVPWYEPQYSIPLLGMLLGNCMNGLALSIDHLTGSVTKQKAEIEGRLILGNDWRQAIASTRRDSLRVGLIPIINAMAAAGIISLPGMMTGQILAGNSPVDAVKYQILIMFLIAAVTGFGAVLSVELATRRLFDDRQRLRLDRLTPSP